MYSRGQERAFRIGSVSIAVLYLADKAVKTNILARNNNDHVSRAYPLLIDRKFDDGCVTVMMRHGLEFEILGVET